MDAYVYVHVYVYLYVYVYVYVYAHGNVYVYVFVMCMCAHMYAYMYVYVSEATHIRNTFPADVIDDVLVCCGGMRPEIQRSQLSHNSKYYKDAISKLCVRTLHVVCVCMRCECVRERSTFTLMRVLFVYAHVCLRKKQMA